MRWCHFAGELSPQLESCSRSLHTMTQVRGLFSVPNLVCPSVNLSELGETSDAPDPLPLGSSHCCVLSTRHLVTDVPDPRESYLSLHSTKPLVLVLGPLGKKAGTTCSVLRFLLRIRPSGTSSIRSKTDSSPYSTRSSECGGDSLANCNCGWSKRS